MLIIGLTGGIACGKNFVSNEIVKQFHQSKIAIFDSDFEVHNLLLWDKEIFFKVKQNFPSSTEKGLIDRKILGEEVFFDKRKLKILEKIIYPKLKKKEAIFIKKCQFLGKKIILFNTPLLFEKSLDKKCHKTIAVIASKQVQFCRFKERFKSQTIDQQLIKKKFINIAQKQINNSKRRYLANFIIYNGLNKGFTIKQVRYLSLKLNKLIKNN